MNQETVNRIVEMLADKFCHDFLAWDNHGNYKCANCGCSKSEAEAIPICVDSIVKKPIE